MPITINQIDFLFKLIFKGCKFRVRGTVIMKPNAHISSWGKYILSLCSFGCTITSIGIWGVRVWVQSLGSMHLDLCRQVGLLAAPQHFPWCGEEWQSAEGVCFCISKQQTRGSADVNGRWINYCVDSSKARIWNNCANYCKISVFQYYTFIKVNDIPVWYIDMR